MVDSMKYEYNEALAKEICEMMGLEWEENHDFEKESKRIKLFLFFIQGKR